MPLLCGPRPMTSGLSGPSPKENARGAHLGPGVFPSLQLGLCLDNAASPHGFRREGRLAREQAEAGVTLATEQGFPYWWHLGR